MELLNVLLASLGSILVLFILTKLMGNRELSQMSMFDYIIGITIGNIAAEMATSLEDDFLKPLLAMVIFAGIAILIYIISEKSLAFRRFLSGKSMILYQDGKLYEKNLKKARLDINEFLTQCRNQGYFNLANLQCAIMESNGKISFLPLSSQRPVTPSDLNLSPNQEKPTINIILDGEILQDNLQFAGKDIAWLKKKLKEQGISDLKQVFLATCDSDNHLSAYLRTNVNMTRSIYE